MILEDRPKDDRERGPRDIKQEELKKPSRDKWWWKYKFVGITGQDNKHGKIISPAAADPKIYEDDETVYREHPGVLAEWFRNPETGFKQGFTIPARPTGVVGRLVLVGDIETSLKLQIASPQRIAFSRDGKAVLRRGSLVVKDANGKALPSFMVVNSLKQDNKFELRFIISDLEASYPITIG